MFEGRAPGQWHQLQKTQSFLTGGSDKSLQCVTRRVPATVPPGFLSWSFLQTTEVVVVLERGLVGVTGESLALPAGLLLLAVEGL